MRQLLHWRSGPMGWIVAGGVVAALAWGYCGQRAARAAERVRYEAQLRAQADSLDAYRERASLRAAEAERLRVDSARLGRDLRMAREASGAAQGRIRRLLAQVPDTIAAPLAEAVDTIVAESVACMAALTNCEQRAGLAETGRADAERNLFLEVAQHDTTKAKWRRAETRGDWSPFTLTKLPSLSWVVALLLTGKLLLGR